MENKINLTSFKIQNSVSLSQSPNDSAISDPTIILSKDNHADFSVICSVVSDKGFLQMIQGKPYFVYLTIYSVGTTPTLYIDQQYGQIPNDLPLNIGFGFSFDVTIDSHLARNLRSIEINLAISSATDQDDDFNQRIDADRFLTTTLPLVREE